MPISHRLAILLIFAARSWACMCFGWPSVKQAWKGAPAVFLGTVEVAKPDEDAAAMIFQPQFVRIRVEEAFKGVARGQTIELHQGPDDCSAKFRTGQHAVFYLYRPTNGGWIVPPCSRAIGSPEPQGDDLLFLRGLPNSAIGTRLSGEVEYYQDSPNEGFKRIAGIPNVTVTVSNHHGVVRHVGTNRAGVFEVFGLAPGKYSVSLDVPAGKKIKFPVVTGSPPVPDDPAAAILPADGGASVSFVVEDDTRVSGRVLDPQDKPVRGVCIDLEPLEGLREGRSRFFGCSDSDGQYHMSMMPPGSYRLVARDEVTLDRYHSQSTLDYPGVRDRQRSLAISIEAGRYLDDLDMRLPSAEKRYRVTGRLQFADGAPADGATVTFTAPAIGYTETTTTDRDGSFGLSALAGVEGQLTAELAVMAAVLKSCPEFQAGARKIGALRFLDAKPIALRIDSDHEHLTLELTARSCESRPRRRG